LRSLATEEKRKSPGGGPPELFQESNHETQITLALVEPDAIISRFKRLD
jgi:hypothetical protein